MAHTLIYGGTFDPIHYGHLITCQRARELLVADRVLFVPAWISPHKLERESAAADHRMAMIHLATAGNPYFAADGRELERGGPSYTFDTVVSLREDNPLERFTLLMGVDQLAKLHTWHRVREMMEGETRVEIALLARGSDAGSRLEEAIKSVAVELGKAVAERLRKALLKTPLVEISSTEIRERVRKGLAIDYLVPPSVDAYIKELGLYLPPKKAQRHS